MTGASRVYATIPQSRDVGPDQYAQRVADVARWSEAAGCRGALVYTDNGIADPWLVANAVIEATETLRPLVAVQPVYAHPYTVAKSIASLAYLHGRAVDLNWLAGGFKNDLVALADETPHDLRYERTVEYASIVMALLRGETVTVDGRWHQVKNLKLAPTLPPHLLPDVMISGSSPAGADAARRLGAIGVRYPRPVQEEAAPGDRAGDGTPQGVRVGIIARESAEAAWRVAHERFPEDRRGEITHALAMKVSDSHWHRQLSATEADGQDPAEPYWLGPFKTGRTFCPYLVGSHERVAEEVRRYVEAGVGTFVLDIPPDEEELTHTGVVLRLAQRAPA